MWTGCTAEIHMYFQRERHARWARHVAESMIKLMYLWDMPDAYPWISDAMELPSLVEQYLQYRGEAEKVTLREGSALDHVSRCRTRLDLDRLDDIQRTTCFDSEEDLFPALCMAMALRFPQAHYTASFRWEMTVSGSIQLVRAQYDGTAIHVRKMIGERPMREDDWSDAPVTDYVAADGTFRKRE